MLIISNSITQIKIKKFKKSQKNLKKALTIRMLFGIITHVACRERSTTENAVVLE